MGKSVLDGKFSSTAKYLNITRSKLRSASRYPWRIFRQIVAKALIHSLEYDRSLRRAIVRAIFSEREFSSNLQKNYSAWQTKQKSKTVALSRRESTDQISELLKSGSVSADVIAKKNEKSPQSKNQDKVNSTVISKVSSLQQSSPKAIFSRSTVKGPKVSIIVPFYKDRAYIEHTINSVIAQTYKNIECILIDDCGGDGSLVALKGLITGDHRFKVIRHKANAGLAAARNTGIVHATGDYFLFLDADDMLYTDSIEKRIATLSDYSAEFIAGTYCGLVQVGRSYSQLEESKINNNLKIVDFITAAGSCPFSCHAPIVRADVVRKIGGFNEHFTQAEDYDLWLRILRHGYCFVPTAINGAVYRMKGGSSMAVGGSLKHLELSMQLYDSVHEPMDPRDIVPGTPFVYEKPISYYQKVLGKADRVIGFAAMQADAQIFADVVKKYISDDALFPVRRHKRVTDRIYGSLRRNSGLVGGFHPTHISEYLVDDVWLVSGGGLSDAQESVTAPPKLPRLSTDIMFFPHKDYHVDIIAQLAPCLTKEGVSFAVVDFARRYRDERANARAHALGIPMVPVSAVELDNVDAKVLVCFNDWDPVIQSFIDSFSNKGKHSVAIVEGVQDYLDADTGRERRAYKYCDTTILPGDFDRRYFDGQSDTRIGGLPNVEKRWLAEYRAPLKGRLAVINVNFSYNVLTDARDAWVKDAVLACEIAGIEYIISQHPADNGNLEGLRVSNRLLEDDLNDANILISRFSTVMLEALAMGRNVIYYNPHQEKVDKFTDPQGAYSIAADVEGLTAALQVVADNVQDNRDAAQQFLATHCGVDPSREQQIVVERIVQELASIGAKARPSIDVSDVK